MDNKKTSIIIRNLLEIKEKTIKNMVEELNINTNFMYSLEKGSKPSIEVMEKIARYLEVSIDYLIGINGKKETLSINESTIGNQNIIGSNNYQKNSKNELLEEISKESEKLNTKDKIKVLNLIYELQNKNVM